MPNNQNDNWPNEHSTIVYTDERNYTASVSDMGKNLSGRKIPVVGGRLVDRFWARRVQNIKIKMKNHEKIYLNSYD